MFIRGYFSQITALCKECLSMCSLSTAPYLHFRVTGYCLKQKGSDFVSDSSLWLTSNINLNQYYFN